MSHQLMQIAYLGVFFVLPGVIGGYIAYSKGRNALLWFLLNTFFPPTVMITFFQKPVRAVEGHYRECPRCREYSKWREEVCRFCQTTLT